MVDLTRLINLTPIQKKYYQDKHRFSVTSAGRRARKTLISRRKLILRALDESRHEKGRMYFHAAPTRQQAKDIFWDNLKKDTKAFQIATPIETELTVKLINDIVVKVIGLDKPERLEGRPWHGGHITEFGNIKDKAWDENIRPCFSDTNGWCMLDGVPEGRNHYYEKALYSAGGTFPETLEEIGAYAENPNDDDWAFFTWFSSDVLTAKEIKSVKDSMDERTFRQEYQGSFEGDQGLAYYAFCNRNLDSSIQYKRGQIVLIGMDFNVNPMTAVFHHIDGEGVLYAFGEAYLPHSNTYNMAEHLKELFPVEDVEIYPDSTGAAMESNATFSDLTILRRAGFEVIAKPKNPRVRDRVNSFNSRLKSATGKIRYKINPKNCPHLIKDFNKVERMPDGTLNNQQEKKGLKHISDGAGYLVAYKFPLIPQPSVTII